MLRVPKGEGPESQRGAFALAAGAAGAAAVFALLGAYLPLFSWFFSALWPLPISLAALAAGGGWGVLALAGALALLSYFLEPAGVGVFFLPLGAGGLLAGMLLPRAWRPGRVWFLSVVLTVILAAGVLAFLTPLGVFSFADLEKEMAAYWQSMASLYEAQGIPEAVYQEYVQILTSAFKRLLPALLFLEAAAMVTVNFAAAYLLARRWKIAVGELPPFREWQMPWYAAWGVILGLAAWLGGDFWGISWLLALGQNVLVAYLPFLLLFGTAVAVFYYHRSSLPVWLKVGLVILGLFYIHVAGALVLALGVFDPLLNYRKLGRSKGVGE